MALVNKYTRLYYYYLCIFVFKNNFLKDSYAQLVPLNKLIFNYLIRPRLLHREKILVFNRKNKYRLTKLARLVNMINKLKKRAENIYKSLHLIYIFFFNLIKLPIGNWYAIVWFISCFKDQYTERLFNSNLNNSFKEMEYIINYLSYIYIYPLYDHKYTLFRQCASLLFEYAFNLYKYMHQFSFVLLYRSLLLHKYFIYKSYIKSIFPLYTNPYLFYILLHIGLQRGLKTYPFYFRLYHYMLQYNYLLSNLRLIKLFKRKNLRKKKKKKPRDFSKDTLFKCITNKYNNYSLRLHVLFKSTKSNSRMTITLNNIVLYRLSCGSLGYRKSNRSAYIAANQLGFIVSKTIRRLLVHYLSYKYSKNLFRKKKARLSNRKLKIYFSLRNKLKRFHKHSFSTKRNAFFLNKSKNGLSTNFFFIGNRELKHIYLRKFRIVNRYLQSMQIRDRGIYHRKIIHNSNGFLRRNSFFPNFQICINHTGFGLGRKASFRPISSGLYWLTRNINDTRWKTRKLNWYSKHKFLRKCLYYLKKSKKKKNYGTTNVFSSFDYSKNSTVHIPKKYNLLLESVRSNIFSSNAIKYCILKNINYIEYYQVFSIISEFCVTNIGSSYILAGLVPYFFGRCPIQYLNILKVVFDLFYFNKVNCISNYLYLYIIYFLFRILFSFSFCSVLFGILFSGILSIKFTSLLNGIFDFVIYLFNYLYRILDLYLFSRNDISLIYFISEYFNLYYYYNTYYSNISSLVALLRHGVQKLLKNSYFLAEQLKMFIKRNILLSFKLANSILYKQNLLSAAQTNRYYYSKFTPLQISSYIYLSAKNISRPHNGCRSRKLRRK